jgi:hypothetical protein
MTDETNVVPEQGTGQEAIGLADDQAQQIPPAQEESSEGEGTKQKFVTKDEFTEAFKEFANQTRSWVKSGMDGAENRLQKEVEAGFKDLDAKVEELKAAGITVSDEQIEQRRQQIVNDVLNSQSPQADIPPNVELTPEQQKAAQEVNNKVQSLYKEQGVELYPNDPEAKGLEAIHDPEVFVEVLEQRLLKKKQRVGAGGGEEPAADTEETEATYTPSKNPVMTGGGKSANSIANITDSDELFKMVKKQKGW